LANTQFERVPSVETLIQDVDAITEMTRADKVFTFITLCDHKTLMNAFKKQAMMQQMEMVPQDDVYSFAYGVLKLAYPQLFMEKG